jgi:thymidylate synthase (FAD)
MEPIKLLDHGYIRLIDFMGGDLDIVRAARTSYNAEWRTGEDAGKDEKLIRRLMRERHTSPFEMVEFKFEVKVPLFVARQWHRHRTWSYSEVSARYTELPCEMYVPDPAVIGVQSKNDKQMRDIYPAHDSGQARWMAELIRAQNNLAYRTYERLLKGGAPRELARGVLPTNTYTRFFAKVDLHNLLGFLALRLDPHAQYEIRVYAEAILTLIEPHVPYTLAAFKAYQAVWAEFKARALQEAA